MNGKTIQTTFYVKNGSVNVIGEGTIKSLEDAAKSPRVFSIAGPNGAVKIGENVTLTGRYGILIFGTGDGGINAQDVTVDVAGTINAELIGISINGNIKNNNEFLNNGSPIVNIASTAEITGTSGLAIYQAGYSKITVADGATLEGLESAIEIRAGELDIQGGNFTSTSTDYKRTGNNGGTTTIGAALAVAQHVGKPELKVTVAGGKFTGVKAFNYILPQEDNDKKNVNIAINGGEFYGEVSALDTGFITGFIKGVDTGFINGGIFSDEVPTEYIAKGMMSVNTNDEKYQYAIVKALTAPVVKLVGDATVTLRKGGTYTELGATWTDNVTTGVLVGASSGTVDTNTVGTYILEYRLEYGPDTEGNKNKSDIVTRTVTVKKTSSGGGGSSSSESNNSSGSQQTDTTKPTDSEQVNQQNFDELIDSYKKENKDNSEKLEQLEKALASAENSDVDQELKDAYINAFLNGITTQPTIEEAELDRGVTRAEMAKMMVMFAKNVLGKERVKTGIVQYPDVDSSLGDLADYIQLAYQLQIMGIDANGNPIENFDPNGEVTRAEFATVFSRILYGSEYNQEGADFYSKHLEALKEANILKNTTPTMKELRGWVMLMLMRTSVNK